MIYVTGDIHGEADRLGPEALKQRYTRELKWCRDMLDAFIS